MSPRPGPLGPDRYELRVEGHLDEHWSTWLGGLSLIRETDGTTTLHAVVTDQAELHGLLAKVRDLGVTLISVTSTDADSPDSQERQHLLLGNAPASSRSNTPQHSPISRPSPRPPEQE